MRVLVAIAAQYRGNNNGDLAMTWAMGEEYGITSKKQLVASLADLLARGLIAKTRQGGKRPLGPSLYALTWQPINDLRGKIQSGATTIATNTWAQWNAPAPGDRSGKNHQHPRGTGSGLPGDQTARITAPQGDQTGGFSGTPGSPPSRSWREGANVRSVGSASCALSTFAAPPPATFPHFPLADPRLLALLDVEEAACALH